MMLLLSPLLKVCITWKAECLDDDSLWDNGGGSTAKFKFKLRSDTVDDGWAAGRTGTGRMSLVASTAVRWLFCPSVRFSIGFSIGTGNTTGKAGIIENPPLLLLVSAGVGGNNGYDWEGLWSWWSTSSSSIGVAATCKWFEKKKLLTSSRLLTKRKVKNKDTKA